MDFRERKIDTSTVLFSTTGMELVDFMLLARLEECAKNNIGMDIYVGTAIDAELAALGITEREAVRVFGALLRNAMQAIVKTAGTKRGLLAMVVRGADGALELRVYDSGVPFPRSVFEHLGERRNEAAGTGNGLADLMEVLERVEGSLEIAPVENPDDIYTKYICVRFDGKSGRYFRE